MRRESEAVVSWDDGEGSCSQTNSTASFVLYGAVFLSRHPRGSSCAREGKNHAKNPHIYSICLSRISFEEQDDGSATSGDDYEHTSLRKRLGLAPNLAGFSNGMAAPFVGRGSSSSPTPNPSVGSIHPQSMADGFDSSPIHGKRGFLVGFGVVGSSLGRCGDSISPSSPPFGHQSS